MGNNHESRRVEETSEGGQYSLRVVQPMVNEMNELTNDLSEWLYVLNLT